MFSKKTRDVLEKKRPEKPAAPAQYTDIRATCDQAAMR